MLIQSNNPEHYAQVRKHWVAAQNPYSKDPTEGVLRVTEKIADQMSDLGLPRMGADARAAFKDVLVYERPPGNSSVSQILGLAQSRGYCAHPCDWVPSSESDSQFPDLYEPWAAWLAANNYTPFYDGVRLTAENFDLWKPKPRVRAFRQFRKRDREAADHFLMTVCAKKPVAIRRALIKVIGSDAMFNGLYPSDVSVMKHFLSDRDGEISDYAAQKLKDMDGLETKEDHARALTKYFKISGRGLFSRLTGKAANPTVTISPKLHEDNVMRHCFSTDLDALVGALGITSKDFVSSFDLENFKGDLFALSMRTTDIEARKILARRVADAGKECPAYLFTDVEPELWQKALDVNLGSIYPSSAFNFLQSKAGTLDITKVRKMHGYADIVPSILRELETGKLPVNIQYDPLRIAALVANKEAAAELLNEALAAGISNDNPRLTMLKFNTTL